MGGALAGALGLCSEAWAQGAAPGTDPQLLNQFDQAFKSMLANPADLDITFRYAELAIQIGDFEAAISALERMLLFNPDLPRVRLELGVLYFRLGSYAVARSYLQRATEGENVPDDVRARVAVYLAEIDRRLSPHQFAGSLYGGLRYQTNANAGPERAAVSVLGLPFDLDNRFQMKNDWNVFLSGSLRHTYDPQLQSGDVLVT
jgi:tetratricopeptide (TPR) repeat protein